MTTILRLLLLIIISISVLIDSFQYILSQNNIISSTHPSVIPVSSICLDVAPAWPGGTTEARIIVKRVEDVRSFNLLLQFEPNQLLAGASTDFQRNDIFFPERMFNAHALNTIRDSAAGQIRLIGLEPAVIQGLTEIGQLQLRVSPDALPGATQIITLTGEIKDHDGNIVQIAPTVATFEVSRIPAFYQPFIQSDITPEHVNN